MPLPWFRFYHEWITDPKVQNLSFEWQRHFVAILCWHAAGTLQSLSDEIIAESFRMSTEELGVMKRSFTSRGFIENGWTPKNWEKRQGGAMTGYERLKKHRDKKRTGGMSTHSPTDNGALSSVVINALSDNGVKRDDNDSASISSSSINKNASINSEKKIIQSDNAMITAGDNESVITARLQPHYPDPATSMVMIHTGKHDIADETAWQIWSRIWSTWHSESLCLGWYEHQRWYSAQTWIAAFGQAKKQCGDKEINIRYIEKIAANIDAHGVKDAKPFAPDAGFSPRPKTEKQEWRDGVEEKLARTKHINLDDEAQE